MDATGFEDSADGFEVRGKEGDVGEADEAVGGERGGEFEVLIVVDFEEGEGDLSGSVTVGEGLLEAEVSRVMEARLIEIADTEAGVGDAVEGKRLCGGGSGDECRGERAYGVCYINREMTDERARVAIELFEKAYRMQMDGELDLAVSLYKQSIALHATAEAHTYLGWTYRFQGKLDAAIEECKKAIATDPDFGNPYNDIGAYLIEQGKPEEAIPWLEKAIRSRRYEAYHYPWYNLGRVYIALETYSKARECFGKSLEMAPRYRAASEALQKLRRLLQ